MLRPRFLLMLIGLILVPLDFVMAEENIDISNKNLSVIERDRIILGDIFDNLDPEKQAIVVSHAPLPGGQTVYHASYLARLAQMHDVAWQPKSPFDQTIIRRQARIVPHEILQQAILEKIELNDKENKDEKGTLRIEFTPNPNIYYISEDSEDFGVQSVQYDAITNRFHAVVMTGQKTTRPMTYRLSGRLMRTVQVPILTRAVEKQGSISKDDIEWIEMAADRVGHDVITDEKETEGVVAKHELRAEQVLRKKDLAMPVLVKKGDLVTAVVEHKNMRLTIQAKALEDGVKGSSIRLINPQSQRFIDGIVMDNRTVFVTGGQ